jgi:hypothetical protein
MNVARVRVRVPALGRVLTPARLRINVEDTSRQDIPARVVASVTIEVDTFDTASPTIVEVDCPLPPNVATAGLEASARLLVHTDEGLRAGDLNTTVAAPVRAGVVTELALVEIAPG